jgi:hypothetical protein
VRIRIRDFWVWTVVPNETRMVKLLISSIPAGGRVTVTCRGPGCPTRRWSRQGISRLDVARRFGGAHLRPGLRLDIRVTRRGWIGRRLIYTVRSRAVPRATFGCLSASNARPQRCPR